MLVLRPIAAGQARYYLEGPTPGRWLGTGGIELGLRGPVDETTLHAVLLGHRPDGEPLLPRRSDRRCGFDLILAAPKSVSLLAALSNDQDRAPFLQAHEQAVAETIGYLERHATWTRRGADNTRIPTTGLVAAAFHHSTSAAGDPHLHTHVVVANLVQGNDGRWSSLDSRSLYRHSRAASAVFQAGLRYHLAQQGLGFEWTVNRHGLGDIVGVPRAAIDAASIRQQQVVKEIQAGLAGRVGRATAAGRTRRGTGAERTTPGDRPDLDQSPTPGERPNLDERTITDNRQDLDKSTNPGDRAKPDQRTTPTGRPDLDRSPTPGERNKPDQRTAPHDRPDLDQGTTPGNRQDLDEPPIPGSDGDRSTVATGGGTPWQDRVAAVGLDRNAAQRLIVLARSRQQLGLDHRQINPGPTALEHLLSQQYSRFRRPDVVRAAAILSVQGAPASGLETVADEFLKTALPAGGDTWTTPGLRRLEQHIVAAARPSGPSLGLVAEGTPRPEGLDEAGQHAVARLTRGGAPVDVLRGDLIAQAQVLDAARHAWESSGHRVAMMSPTVRGQARWRTLAGLERSPPPPGHPTVILVDNADRWSTNDLHQVMSDASARQAKIVLLDGGTTPARRQPVSPAMETIRAQVLAIDAGPAPGLIHAIETPPPTARPIDAGPAPRLIHAIETAPPTANAIDAGSAVRLTPALETPPPTARPIDTRPAPRLTPALDTAPPTANAGPELRGTSDTVQRPSAPALAPAVAAGRDGTVILVPTGRASMDHLVEDWKRQRVAGRPPDRQPRMVALGPEEAEHLNAMARFVRVQAGELQGPGVVIGGRHFQAGDEVAALRKDTRLGGVPGGTVGRVTAVEADRGQATIQWAGREDAITVGLDTDPSRPKSRGRKAKMPLTHSYATTPPYLRHGHDGPVLGLGHVEAVAPYLHPDRVYEVVPAPQATPAFGRAQDQRDPMAALLADLPARAHSPPAGVGGGTGTGTGTGVGPGTTNGIATGAGAALATGTTNGTTTGIGTTNGTGVGPGTTNGTAKGTAIGNGTATRPGTGPARSEGTSAGTPPARDITHDAGRTLAELAGERDQLARRLQTTVPPDTRPELRRLSEERAWLAANPNIKGGQTAMADLDARHDTLTATVHHRAEWLEGHREQLERYADLTRSMAWREMALGRGAEIRPTAAVVAELGRPPTDGPRQPAWRRAAQAIEAHRDRWQLPDRPLEVAPVAGPGHDLSRRADELRVLATTQELRRTRSRDRALAPRGL